MGLGDMKMPSTGRLATARDTAKRMLDRSFRESMEEGPSGERRVIIAEAHDRVEDVFNRYDTQDLPVTFSVRVGGHGHVLVEMFQTEEAIEDSQDCGPDASFGMLISLLLQTEGPVRVRVADPAAAGYQLALT